MNELHPKVLLGLVLIGVCTLVVALAAPADEPTRAWDTATTVALKGCTVKLSSPVLVARSKGYLWFPTLARLGDGDLLAVMSNYADVNTNSSTSSTAWSTDGGLTWGATKDALYSDSHLRLAGGDEILLPYYLYPRKEGLGAPYQLVARGRREIRLVKDGLTVTGWPRPTGSLEPKLGLGGFVFNGQTVALKPAGHLATLYGYFKDTKRYSLVAAESADGVRWQVRSTVADENCKLRGAEGPCEAALCRLKDGRLMCVFRLASNVPYGQVYSRDEGKTWTEPVAMAGPFSVQPSLAVLADGTVILTGGRPGLFAWVNLDGKGTEWQRIDLQAHHNACRPGDAIRAANNTSSYTEVVPLDETHLLCIYDRIPNGWHPIPAGSADTNSVWVVRLELTRPVP